MVVRTDLPRGFLAAAVVHATGESVESPHPPGTYAVVLGASAADLERLAATLKAASVPHKVIVENQGDYANQALAVGITPAAKSKIRRYVSSLPLVK